MGSNHRRQPEGHVSLRPARGAGHDHPPFGPHHQYLLSLSGKVGAPGQAAYCASKHGVIGLTLVMAIDLAPYNITVNAICPGMNETEMMQEVIAQRAASRNQTLEEVRQGILVKTPLGRFGRPEDVA